MEDEIETVLKVIALNTRPKWSTQIIVGSDKTTFTTTFNPPLELDDDKHYEIALVNLETYYSFPNVSEENNMFEYHHASSWKKVFIPVGAYEIRALNSAIQSIVGDIIQLEPNNHTLKYVMTIKPRVQSKF